MLVAHAGRQRHGALDDGRVPVAIEPHQPLEVRQDGQRAAAPRRGEPLRDLARRGLVQRIRRRGTVETAVAPHA